MSETAATILSAILGAVIGGVFVLVGVWVGYYFSKRASEGDRHAELQYTIYKKVESVKNLLIAFKKKMISQEVLHEKWNRVTEEILVALIRSGLSKAEKKKVLHTINLKWENPESVKKLQQLADDLLKKVDPEFHAASNELLDELGVKREDIDPVILTSRK
jgi:uncharacterized protein YjiS (DUF1127 family)